MEKDCNQFYDFGTDAIVVTRVSTPEQVLTPESSPQKNDLIKYAEAYNFKNLKFFGTTESGFLKEDKKIGWNQVTDFIEKNPTFRTIICTEISRLGRNDEILMHIKNYLIENKIQLLVKDINFELLNRFGQIDQGKDIIFGLYASLANAEMRQKRERFKRALKDYRKLGYSIGGKCLFGYERVVGKDLKGKKTYIIDPEQAEEIKTIYDWYLNGIDGDLTITSLSRIAYECKAKGFSKYLHSKRNVNKCLKESAYIGFKITKNKRKNPLYWNYKDEFAPKYIDAESYECKYPRILDDAIFEAVQQKMSSSNTHVIVNNNNMIDKSRKHITILSKIIKCSHCGKFMIGDYRYKDGYIKHTYRCHNAKSKLLRKCDNTQTISMVMMDSVVWAFIKAKVEDITAQKNLSKSETNLKKIRKEIERLKVEFEKFDSEIEIENEIYRTSIRYSSDKEKVTREYQKKLKKIDTDRKNLEKIIFEKERVLKIATEETSSNSKLDEIVRTNIDRIENSKHEMYKYVHLLVKYATPIYSDKNFAIIEIISFNNLVDVLDYRNDDNEMPAVIGEKRDDVYYICIDKHNPNNIKCRLVSGEQINFDTIVNKFNSYSKYYSIEHIFDIDLNETDASLFSDLQRSVEILPYKKLTFYNSDNI